ncbi:lactonase family protein [Rhodobacter maris]|uniref:Uncharacterized protein n=1 Tax=Rhodobacter maris TaxID=446682 RepID=A0A285SFG5_9RHOB|nr:hypothetical protein [Rhodobacter maris]SOC06415.1 hypothetical protein SAMN05877831_10513 [Rhodobacter maris]
MASGLIGIGTLCGGGLDLPAGQAEIWIGGSAAEPRITVANYSFGASEIFGLSASGALNASDERLHLTETRIPAVINGSAGALSLSAIRDGLEAAAQGDTGARLGFLDAAAFQAQAASLLTTEGSGQALLIAAPVSGAGITVYGWNDAQATLSLVQTVADTELRYLDRVSDMALVQSGNARFLFVGSASEHGVTGFALDASGTLGAEISLGMTESVPVQTVTALASATIGTTGFLITAAAGSSSLTVMKVGADGSIDVTDHMIDDLHTRFAGASKLEVVSVGDHVFVLAAGSDDGLTLFAPHPGGAAGADRKPRRYG